MKPIDIVQHRNKNHDCELDETQLRKHKIISLCNN